MKRSSMIPALRWSALLAAVALSSACGGNSSAPPLVTNSQQSTQSRAALTISIPAAVSTSARRRNYVSPATASGSFSYPGNSAPQTFALTPGSAGCTTTAGATTCRITVNAPVGNDEMLTVSLFDAGGKLLSTVTIAATIVSGQTTPITFTLDGVPKALSLALSPSTLTEGKSASAAIVLNALDADGNTIIAPGSYADANGNPLTITLKDSDTTGATGLSKTSVTGPTSGITLAYNGSSSVSSVDVTASATGLAAQQATLTIAPPSNGVDCVTATPPSTKALVSVGEGSPQVERFTLGAHASPYDSDLSSPVGPAFGVTIAAAGTTFLEAQETLLQVCADSATSSEIFSYLPLQADGEIGLVNQTTIGAAQPESAYTKDADSIAFYDTAQFVKYDDQMLDADPVPSASPAPSAQISGTATKLDAPFGLAFDASGQTYAGNQANVTIYAANARGNVAPKATLSLPNAGLVEPIDVGMDAKGNLYVLYGIDLRPGGSAAPAVAEYSGTSTTPIAVISGAKTELGTFEGAASYANTMGGHVSAIAVDPAGDVYVGSGDASDGDVVYEFKAGANGDVAPEKTTQPMFYGNSTTVTSLAATAGVLYVLDEGYQVEAFGPGSTVTAFTPEASNGEGYNLTTLRVDAAGNLYAAAGIYADQPGGVLVFPPGTMPSGNGGAHPAKTIGSVGNPIAVAADGTVYQSSVAASISARSSATYYLEEGGDFTSPTQSSAVNVFAAGSTTQTGTLSGPFYSTNFITDATGHLFDVGIVNDVNRFSTTASGVQTASASYADYAASTLSSTISSYDSDGVAVDASGNVYVASTLTNSIAVFPPNSTTPARTIVGDKTLLYHPQGMTVDASGNLYVASIGNGILVFPSGANGNVAPSYVDAPGAYFLAIGPAVITSPASKARNAGSRYGASLGMGHPEHDQLTPAAYLSRFARPAHAHRL